MKDKKEKGKKKSRIFGWFMLLYVCIGVSAILMANGWLWDQAQMYQTAFNKAEDAHRPVWYMDELVKTVDSEMLTEWLHADGECNISEYTDESEYVKYFSEIMGNKEVVYKLTDENNTYDILLGKKIVARIKIGSNGEFDEYGFSGWKIIDTEVLSFVDETFNKTIVADKKYTVYVNGKELTEDYRVIENVDVMQKHMADLMGEEYGINIYKLDGFLVEPEIYAVDKMGNNVDNTTVAMDMAEFVDKEEKVMSDDKLTRVSATFNAYFSHMNKLMKYDEMKKYLVQGTDAYTLIANAQQSIEWVVPAKKITVVEQTIDEYEEYGDNYFTCNVYINMLKDYGYTTKNEYFDAKVLFKKVNNVWYLDTFILN